MTQNPGPYPSPYPQQPYQYPPGYGYDPMQAALAPAKRAGVLMIVMGTLMLAGGMCCGGLFLFPADQMQQILDDANTRAGQEMTADQLRITLLIYIAILAGLGLPLVVLGALVRRGGMGVTIAAIVLTSIMLLFGGLGLLGTLASGQPVPIMMAAGCINLVPVALLALLLVWLIQAMRAASSINAMQMQYQQQYWQYSQQQQMYGQGYPPAAGSPNVQAPMTNEAPNPNAQGQQDGGSHGPPSQG